MRQAIYVCCQIGDIPLASECVMHVLHVTFDIPVTTVIYSGPVYD